MLKIGTKAIDFSLPDMNGKMHSLSTYHGKKIILYFYPKDLTTGCTMQALSFKDHMEEIIEKNYMVIGISKDAPNVHLKFVQKYDLPFLLLSDVDHKVIEEYGVWALKKLYGKDYMGVVRTTYIINEEGIITNIFERVNAKNGIFDILKNI